MKKILFCDTLSTGLTAGIHELYRIGGIIAAEDGGTLTEKGRFELSMRPTDRARINDGSLAAGRMTRAELARMRPQDEAFRKFLSELDRLVDADDVTDKLHLCGYNVTGLDRPFIREWFRLNGSDRFRHYFSTCDIDLLCLSGWYAGQGEEDGNSMAAAARRLGVRARPNLTASCLRNAETCLDMYTELKRRGLEAAELRHVTGNGETEDTEDTEEEG